jgi:membrane AbrB-like protein
MPKPHVTSLILPTLFLTFLSALGGAAASLTVLPLPYMLGALLTSGAIALFLPNTLPTGYAFPHQIRLGFMAVIGVMVGAQVNSEMLAQVPALITSIIALSLFTLLAHSGNYLLFRRIGGYDRPTAFFAGTPGGLMESLAMGEASGADLKILTLQQFMRIILVITLVPMSLSLWYGEPLGSASGASVNKETVALSAVPVVLLVGLSGTLLGRLIRLPAAQLTGPLLAAAIVSISGLAPLPVPDWLVNVAQVVIGASLGLRFTGLKGRMMLRACGLALLSVAMMLTLGMSLVLPVAWLTGVDVDILLISYAPGGVTEMALIALSLNANPALVTLHHVYRIFLTVIAMGLTARWMGLSPKTNDTA